MRNYLLAGTSALALALTGGVAKADTAPGKFDIKLSGDAYFEAGYASQAADVNARALNFLERFRLNIIPTATADNGITYGARARIRANNGAATNAALIDGDRSYVFVKGNFGEFDLGVADGVSEEYFAVYQTWDWNVLAQNDEFKRYIGGTPATTAAGALASQAFGQWGGTGVNDVALLQSNSVANRLNYYSPRFFGSAPTTGLQGAISYAPKLGQVLTGINRSSITGEAGGQQTTTFQDVYEITANYVENFDGIGVKLAAGYTGGTAVGDGVGAGGYNGLSAFNFQGRLSYAGFEIGGQYLAAGKSGYTTARYVKSTPTAAVVGAGNKSNSALAGYTNTRLADQDAWTVGGQYTYGPYILGVSYEEEADAGNTSIGGGRTLDFLNAGVTYIVAPGLKAAIEYTHFDSKSDVSSFSDNGDVFLLRTIVNW